MIEDDSKYKNTGRLASNNEEEKKDDRKKWLFAIVALLVLIICVVLVVMGGCALARQLMPGDIALTDALAQLPNTFEAEVVDTPTLTSTSGFICDQDIFLGNPGELVQGVTDIVPEQLYVRISNEIPNPEGHADYESAGRVTGFQLILSADNSPNTSWKSASIRLTILRDYSAAVSWLNREPGTNNPPPGYQMVGDLLNYHGVNPSKNSCGGDGIGLSMQRCNVTLLFSISNCEGGTSVEDMVSLAMEFAKIIDSNILSSVSLSP
jgi:hypothetical protein